MTHPTTSLTGTLGRSRTERTETVARIVRRRRQGSVRVREEGALSYLDATRPAASTGTNPPVPGEAGRRQ